MTRYTMSRTNGVPKGSRFTVREMLTCAVDVAADVINDESATTASAADLALARQALSVQNEVSQAQYEALRVVVGLGAEYMANNDYSSEGDDDDLMAYTARHLVDGSEGEQFVGMFLTVTGSRSQA